MMNEPILSGAWDTGPHDILADLEAARQQLLSQTGFEPPWRGPVPVSRARWQWLREGGWIDDQGRLTPKAMERFGDAVLYLSFELLEG